MQHRASRGRKGVVAFAAFGVDDVGEEERPALLIRHAALELPSDQSMQLGILVDRAVDPDEQVARLKLLQMSLGIGLGSRGLAAATAFGDVVPD